jgi:hypothetical protein
MTTSGRDLTHTGWRHTEIGSLKRAPVSSPRSTSTPIGRCCCGSTGVSNRRQAALGAGSRHAPSTPPRHPTVRPYRNGTGPCATPLPPRSPDCRATTRPAPHTGRPPSQARPHWAGTITDSTPEPVLRHRLRPTRHLQPSGVRQCQVVSCQVSAASWIATGHATTPACAPCPSFRTPATTPSSTHLGASTSIHPPP